MDSPEFASAPKELDRLLKTVANVHALPELVRKLSPLKQPKEKRLFAPVRAEPASTVSEFVCRNQICLANTTSLSILANGLCSICEMLYDHPEYILGSVRKASISEIWNSEKALNLYSPQQENIESDSPCKTCEVFSKCKTTFGKRICYLDITKVGGNQEDPDPRCPLSKKTKYIL